MGMVLAFALAAFVAAHFALVVGLARRSALRSVAALVIAPLAPWWGYRAGMRRRGLAWLIALAVYTLGLALA
jgi:hypothetical protein